MINEIDLKDIKNIVLDSGVIIEYFKKGSNNIKKFLRKHFFNENRSIQLHGHYLLKSEIFYITCRSIGIAKAKDIIYKLEKFINYISGKLLFEKAGLIKCKYPIALPDCYSIASGIHCNCPVLFLEENELTEEIIDKLNEEFNSKIYIIT